MKWLKHARWTVEELDLLGKITDKEMSNLFGRPIEAITRKRQRLGIGSPNKGRMSDAEKALLGTMTDDSLAVQLGRSVLTIKKWRRKLRISMLNPGKRGRRKESEIQPPFSSHRGLPKQVIAHLKKFHDAKVAKSIC